MTTSSGEPIAFSKGHGTENDFVIVADYGAEEELAPDTVRALCDRRAGIGADGLLRVARGGALVEAGELDIIPEGTSASDWFMDYRNADGSVAEMCGNGLRVFAHWLAARGLVDEDTFTVGTRAGARRVTVHAADERAADVSIDMGEPRLGGEATASMGPWTLSGYVVDVGNPHLAAVIGGLDAERLAELELTAPALDPAQFPAGGNLELVTPLADGRVDMRVWERGVGETRSCGTGTVAAARAALLSAGRETGDVVVGVPGGEVAVRVEPGRAVLRGPSRLVAEGRATL
ncbi:diaminopimelate epimerase [Corynebacterium otitidis]|nr:diaminopimelate epimerase [Corynebacterium otitidis]